MGGGRGQEMRVEDEGHRSHNANFHPFYASTKTSLLVLITTRTNATILGDLERFAPLFTGELFERRRRRHSFSLVFNSPIYR